MKMLTGIVLQVLLVLGGCATDPGQRAYEVADFRVRWLDRYQADQRNCERAGGVIVQERHGPEPLRIGKRGPEIGSRYYCLR